jgi:hypothetical protein
MPQCSFPIAAVDGQRSIPIGVTAAVRTKLPSEQHFKCPVRSRLLPLRLGQKSAMTGH